MALTATLRLRLSAAELEDFERAAAERGVSRAELAREALRAVSGAAPAPAEPMGEAELLGLVARAARNGERWAIERLAARLLEPPSRSAPPTGPADLVVAFDEARAARLAGEGP